MNRERRPPGEGGNRWMWLSVGMFIQNMLLAASSLDIGIQFISAHWKVQKIVKKYEHYSILLTIMKL